MRIIFFGLLIIQPILLVISSFQQRAQTGSGKNQVPVRVDGQFFTSPLLDCDMEFDHIPPFKTQIEEYVASAIKRGDAKRISVHFRQLNNGYTFGINEDDKFQPASLFKVAAMMYVLKKAENHPEILDESVEMKFRNDPVLGETDLRHGQSYTIRELVSALIINSDNHALATLQFRFQNRVMWQSVLSELGYPITSTASTLNNISPKAYSILLRVLYNAAYLNRQYSEEALSILSKAKFKGGIVQGVGSEDIIIANKFGLRKWSGSVQLHESALVYLSNAPYTLTIMTEGKDENDLKSILSRISEITYKHVNESVTDRQLATNNSPTRLTNPILDCDSHPDMAVNFSISTDSLIDDFKKDETIKDLSIYVRELRFGDIYYRGEDHKYNIGGLTTLIHTMAILREVKTSTLLKANEKTIQDESNARRMLVVDVLQKLETGSVPSKVYHAYGVEMKPALVNLFEDIGVKYFDLENVLNASINTEEASMLFRVLYNATILSREDSENILSALSSYQAKQGIRKGIGNDDYFASIQSISTCEILGDHVYELCDLGIVYMDDNPYIICVMIKGANKGRLSESIYQLSKLVYKEIKSKKSTSVID
ncbi:MAG: class A beta-lactamase-related serine hydrolase [Flavobacteriales bacterium]|nr:class A beta-lactamase-related serine hydrolase [Flavobacteriales bacterium]